MKKGWGELEVNPVESLLLSVGLLSRKGIDPLLFVQSSEGDSSGLVSLGHPTLPNLIHQVQRVQHVDY